MSDIAAHEFPRDLDGHPLLAWMGEDWVSYVALELLGELRRQGPGTEMDRIGCVGTPELTSRARPRDGVVTAVSLRLRVQMLVRESSGTEHLLRGVATFGGPEPLTVELQIDATPAEHLEAILEEAKGLVQRPGNDFLWSSWEDAEAAARELDEHLAAVRAGSLRTDGLGSLFAPTGPLQELAVSSGWHERYAALADRVDTLARR